MMIIYKYSYQDLPKLHTISFLSGEGALYGDGRNVKIINGFEDEKEKIPKWMEVIMIII